MTNTNMNKNQTKSRVPIYRRPIIVIPLAIVLILVVILIVWLVSRPQSDSSTNSSNPPSVSEPATDHSPQQPESSESQPADDQPEPKAIQYEGADPNDSEEITGSVANASVENGQLFVAVTIGQFLENPGTCDLSLVNAHGETVASVNGPAFADVTTSVCQLPELPVGQLPSGEYQLVIKVNADGKTGTIKDGVTL